MITSLPAEFQALSQNFILTSKPLQGQLLVSMTTMSMASSSPSTLVTHDRGRPHVMDSVMHRLQSWIFKKDHNLSDTLRVQDVMQLT